jgi:hypothetical protein
MTHTLPSTLDATVTKCPALRNHISFMEHITQFAVGAVMSSMGVKGHTMLWEAHQHDQQFGQNETIDIGKSQSPQREDNARINKVSAMRPGLVKIIEKVNI